MHIETETDVCPRPTFDLGEEPIIAMFCRAQEPGLLDLGPIDLTNIGPRLITTGPQELLQSGASSPSIRRVLPLSPSNLRLLTCRTSTIGTPLQSNLGIFALQLGGSNV